MMNKSKIVFAFVLILASLSVFAEEKSKIVRYISPNNDGVQDELLIPLSISERRYISEWALVIENAGGNVVRTIGNKEKRPEKMTFKSFFQALFAKKTGVEVPKSVTWNGVLDSGEIAPDGEYLYYITATDDNGNRGETKRFKITVDNTAPDIELTQPSKDKKTFGAGSKAVLAIQQKGSVEDLWTGTIANIDGQIMRTWEWKNSAPETVNWDGKDEYGVAVPEGVYSYKVTATDKAGNVSEPASITNIIYDAIPRSVNMIVKESPFSPNGDGIRDTIEVSPVISNSSGLVSWEIQAVDKNGSIVRSWSGTKDAPSPFDYNGSGENGSVLRDGDYQLKFTASFNNGQESLITRNFTIDNTPPQASIKASGTVFSPDGDGKLDTISFAQETSHEKNWVGEIIDGDGNSVKKWDFGELPPASVVWDGTDKNGKIIDAPGYKYRLSATDLAGNSSEFFSADFELNTGTTEILLTVSDDAFSPNGDKEKDALSFIPQVKTTSPVVEYKLTIFDEKGKTVRTFAENKALPASLSWNGIADDGTKCADGTYSASLFTRSQNGNESSVTTKAFVIDTVYPEVNIEAPYLVFSPGNDGNKDELLFTIKSSAEASWVAEIRNAKKELVRTVSWEKNAVDFAWNGCDESGNIVADGKYTFTISTVDAAGNKASAAISDITIDTRVVKASLTAEYEAFAPNNDGFRDVQIFGINVTPADGISAWKFTIKDESGKAVKEWSDKDQKNVPAEIKWNGFGDGDTVAEGNFTASLDLEYLKGDKITANSTPFICSVTPPQLRVKTSPQYFSPDNDGVDDDLRIALSGTDVVPFTKWSFEIKTPNGKKFWSTSGKSSITERILWDGRSNTGELVQSATDYPYTFTVTDELGMTSVVEGIIPVDVLVIRVGNVLKMQIPSIIFRSDAADFGMAGEKAPDGSSIKEGITAEQKNNNVRVLKRVADILNKFKDYNVTIEGHANNVSGTEEEETVDTAKYGKALVPLSKERAEYVKAQLVKYGIDSGRLSTAGMGGRQPIAARDDKDNWWKNRRVEFILNK